MTITLRAPSTWFCGSSKGILCEHNGSKMENCVCQRTVDPFNTEKINETFNLK